MRSFFFLLLIFTTSINGDELKFVQAIWRHGGNIGHRVSTSIYRICKGLFFGGLPFPLDTYNESFWPNGWEQLTSKGYEQMNELGRFFRSRYGNAFLLNEYGENEISVQSSKSQRAIDSAHGFLQGFCPFNSSLHVTPFCPAIDPPIIYRNGGDPLLKPTSFDCPSYDQKAEQANKQLLANLTEQYQDLIEFLAEKTGYGSKMDLHKAAKLNDLNREIAHRLKQPEWLYKTWPQYGDNTTLEIVTELKRIERTNEFNKPELARLRGGFLLADWIGRAQKVANGTQTRPSKMMLYSSHDGTLQSLMYAMGIADNGQIPYAATIIMEIYQRSDDGQFYVELYYRHKGQLEKRQIPDCGLKCQLDEFVSKLNPSAIYSFGLLEKECTVDSNSFSDQTNSGQQHTIPLVFTYLPSLHLIYTIFNEIQAP